METILIVDDTPENLIILSQILKPFYKVKVANSGIKALNLIASGDIPDLILLDIMMPEMNGYEVCKNSKKIHSRATSLSFLSRHSMTVKMKPKA